MRSTKRLSNAAPVAMRMALAAGFLSAVADRFGLWGPIGTPGVSWGGFAKFLDYTATILPFLPTTLVAGAGWGGAPGRDPVGGGPPPRGGGRPGAPPPGGPLPPLPPPPSPPARPPAAPRVP